MGLFSGEGGESGGDERQPPEFTRQIEGVARINFLLVLMPLLPGQRKKPGDCRASNGREGSLTSPFLLLLASRLARGGVPEIQPPTPLTLPFIDAKGFRSNRDLLIRIILPERLEIK
jgi:hypothetical protein